MGLFGRNEDRAARKAATEAEVERLVALPVADLATELVGAFESPDGGAQPKGALQVVVWVMRDHKPSTADTIRLREPVREALAALEHAGLLTREQTRGGGILSLNRAGLEAVAGGSVRTRLS